MTYSLEAEVRFIESVNAIVVWSDLRLDSSSSRDEKLFPMSGRLERLLKFYKIDRPQNSSYFHARLRLSEVS